MFTPDERERVRARLLELARSDERVTAAALTGSASQNAEDRWSDIDLSFAVASGVAVNDVLTTWTRLFYRELDALHHFDLSSGVTIYRAFLLRSCLEVDVAFTPAAAFGPIGPQFRLVFGELIEQQPHGVAPATDHLIGLGWHHVLHAWVCIERRRPWQAEYWISGIRDQALALACLRFGERAVYAKGVDRLPQDVTAPFEAALVRSLGTDELRRALRVATAGFAREVRQVQPELATRLEAPLIELVGRA